MADLTPAAIRSFAPEFVDTTAFPDVLLQTFIDDARAFMSDTTWTPSKFPIGWRYLTLHMLTLWRNAQPGVDGLGNPTPGGAPPTGAVKWVQSDNQQVGYSGPAATLGPQFHKPGSDAYWEASVWGQAYTSLRRAVFGNRVLPGGPPCVDIAGPGYLGGPLGGWWY